MNTFWSNFHYAILPRLLRQVLFWILFIIIWILITNHIHPFSAEAAVMRTDVVDSGGSWLLLPILPLFFHLDVLIRLVLVILANQAALAAVSHYCAALHAPMPVSSARRFLRYSTFLGKGLPTISIKNGAVEGPPPNRLLQTVGGPGYVMIDPNNAALFEMPNGDFKIYTCTTGSCHN
ncbi:MAG TPA: hypothetical protein VN376_10680, partial [Longilinea sp.]|nr:hypothetical protein [Longilinea sp.]